MATLVQSPAGVTSTGTGSVAPTCTAASAGNTLIIKVAWNTTPGQTDINIPSGWTASALADIDNTNNVRGRILKKPAAGGETSVTITAVTGTPDMAAYIEEWSGADASASEDTMRSELSGSTSPPGTGAIATPGAGDFATGFIAIKNNNALNTPTNGYTLVGTVVSGNATAGNQVRLASLYKVAPGATDVQLTEGGTARPFIGQLTTILPAAGLTLPATAGRLDFSATGPKFSTSFGTTAGRLDISATGPTFTTSLATTAGALTIAATGPTFRTNYAAVAGVLSLAGTGPTLAASLPVTAGVLTFSAAAPVYSASLSFSVTPGRLDFAGTGPTLAMTIPVTAGQLQLRATAAALNTLLPVTAGRINLIGGTAPAFAIPKHALVALRDWAETTVRLSDRGTAFVRDFPHTRASLADRASTVVALMDRPAASVNTADEEV